MSVFAISHIFCIFTTFIVTVVLFLKAKGRKDVLMWGVLCVSAMMWGVGGLIATTTMSVETAILGWQIANIGSIWVCVAFFHFVYIYFQLKQKNFLRLVYALGFFYLYVNFFKEEWFFKDVSLVFGEYYWIDWLPHKGPVYLMFYITFYWFLLLYSFFFLVKGYIKANAIRRNEIKYLILSSLMGWIGAHWDFLAVFKRDIYPYGNFLVAIYPAITAYAIIRHGLLDINFVFKKSLIYSISIGILSLIYLGIVIILEQVLQNIFGYQSKLVSIFTAFGLGIIFIPLRNIVQGVVDRLIFKGTQQEIVEQNERLRQEAVQSARYKTLATLTGGIVDEIKNPLTTISGYNHHLPHKLEDKDFLLKFSKILDVETQRINKLLQNLNEYSRPAPLLTSDTDILRLVEETLAMLKSTFIEQGINVIKHLAAAENVTLKVDASQLRQALINILMNSQEAMLQGGDLTVSTSKTADSFKITITDRGCGIKKEDIDKVFDPFFTTKPNQTGLGLSIAQGIIENHKGRILIMSEAGKWTTVEIRLPLNVGGSVKEGVVKIL